ncbi:FecR family protein [Tunicatimonas pelagia]|uniref:FecR family protein n=1 Tax=Tunicatimonas pelagia TaxID=931531 RepID=UPI0026669A0B|nr:FecR domain-containing protein [Tunicatimonas pelagia]WKN44126.1 FecR domain-containing protein [Tunicatimonas pelagia]
MYDPHYIKSLFVKFYADECTPEEIETIIEYLRASDGSEAFPHIDEVRAKLGEFPKLDEQRSDDIFSQIISRDALSVTTARPKHRFVAWGWKIAAAFVGFLFLAGIGWWYYDYEIRTALYATSFGEVKTITLPDGTKVVLNANSALRVPSNTPEDSVREVWLNGEAFFSVTHTEDHRKFIVHTAHELQVEVLGTEFNVNSREEKATVVLNSGKVKVQLSDDSQLSEEWVMKPGELIEYEAKNQHVDQKEVDTLLYTSWRNNLLVFKDTSLKEIAQLMSDNYGYKVQFERDSLAQLLFTGSVPADQSELLLQTLSISFDLDITQNEQTITIDSR